MKANYPTEIGELCITEDGRVGRYDGLDYVDRYEDDRGRDHNIAMVRVVIGSDAEILPLQSLTAAEEWQTA
jgi:hypothetical protein